MKKIVILFVVFLLSGCANHVPVEPTSPVYEPGAFSSSMRRTILYYANDNGYILPVMKMIPWEEGIGKAALEYLVGSVDNAASAAKMGLSTVVPEGVTFDLEIDADKNAILNIIGLEKSMIKDAETEKTMLVTLVNTLMEFPGIESVTVHLDGKKVNKLPHGTKLNDNMTSFLLNVEDGTVAASATDSDNSYTIYIPNAQCALQIPITCYSETTPTFETAVTRMITGFSDPTLRNCFPDNTKVLSAVISDNVAAVNFSTEFAKITTHSEGVLEAVYNSLFLTAEQFSGVSQLNLYIDGVAIDESLLPLSAPVFVNSFVE